MNERSADFAEARWRRLTDADAEGVLLSGADREYLERFIPRSAEGRAEAELFAALAHLGDGDESPQADAALIQATVQHVMAARRIAPAAPVSQVASQGASQGVSQGALQGAPPIDLLERRRGAGRWVVAGAVAVAAVAAVVVGWFGVQAMRSSTDLASDSPIAMADTAPGEDTAMPVHESTKSPASAPVPEPAAGLIVSSGNLVDSTGAPLVASAAVQGSVRVESDRGCVGLGEATACFERGARLEVDAEQPTRLVLVEGEGAIEVVPAVAPSMVGSVMTVEIAGDSYSIDSPVSIQTVVHERGSTRVTVLEGRVEVVDADGQSHVLEAGQVRQRTRSARSSTRPDAKTLLARARASRSEGNRSAAIAHYEKLLRLYPRASASRAAMISLGDLYLEARKPKAALAWFDRYLRKGGALAQEAYIGRIKALGALGRDRQKQKAIEAFRIRYPSSRYAGTAG
ncbi:MAG: hypothetical protein AAGF11_47715 [Myxococcota bacterium]